MRQEFEKKQLKYIDKLFDKFLPESMEMAKQYIKRRVPTQTEQDSKPEKPAKKEKKKAKKKE